MTTFSLNTGAEIPSVGFTVDGINADETYDAVKNALKSGYRLIDTSFHSGAENHVGKAIRDSGIPRESIFVATKMWVTQAYDPEAALDKSLRNLNTCYVDLYLVHWPVATPGDPNYSDSCGNEVDQDYGLEKIWQKFQKLPKSKAKSLGVCNVSSSKLLKLLDNKLDVIPAVNQSELHPDLPQNRLVDICKEKGIVPQASSPLGEGDVEDPFVKEIAHKHNVSPDQAVLSWNLARGVAVLPQTTADLNTMKTNLNVHDLSTADVQQLDTIGNIVKIKANIKRVIVPSEPIFKGVDIFDGDVDSEPVIAC